MKDGHVNDAAQGAAEDMPQDVAQDLAFGARAARALPATPPPPPPRQGLLEQSPAERPTLKCAFLTHSSTSSRALGVRFGVQELHVLYFYW